MCWMKGRSSSPGSRREAPLTPSLHLFRYRESPLSRNNAKLIHMSETDNEFLPLPYYPWDRRPSYSSLDDEEVATALYLAEGEFEIAARHLRVDPLRLIRAVNRSERLRRLHAELASLLNDKVLREYKRAFESQDDRRREWAASKVSQTKQFQAHPLAPNSNVPAAVTLANGPGKIIISWEEPLVIEHQPESTPEGHDD